MAGSTETGVGTPELLEAVANVTFSGPSKGFDRSGYGWIRFKSVSREASREVTLFEWSEHHRHLR